MYRARNNDDVFIDVAFPEGRAKVNRARRYRNCAAYFMHAKTKSAIMQIFSKKGFRG